MSRTRSSPESGPGIFRSVMTSWWGMRRNRSQASDPSCAVATSYDSSSRRQRQPGADVRLVVHDQDAEGRVAHGAPPPRSPAPGGRRCGMSCPGARPEVDAAPVLADQFLGQGQAHARPPSLGGEVGLEQALVDLRRDSRARCRRPRRAARHHGLVAPTTSLPPSGIASRALITRFRTACLNFSASSGTRRQALRGAAAA